MDPSRFKAPSRRIKFKLKLLKIDPLAHVSAIERHLVAKGYGLPVNETSGSGSEDMNSDTDDETPETHAVTNWQSRVKFQVEFLGVFVRIGAWATIGRAFNKWQDAPAKHHHLSGEKKLFYTSVYICPNFF